MLNICIIDDEYDARLLLREMLTELVPDSRIIGEAHSKKTAIDLLKNMQPDAVFLDIDLKDGSGFEVLSALPPPQYALVFATAFDAFALKAFHYNAIDYLLKPIGQEELKKAVGRIKKSQVTTDFHLQIKELLLTAQTRRIEKLVLHTTQGVHFLPIADILHLESAGNYTTIRTIGGEKIVVSSHIGNFDYLTSNEGIAQYTTDLFFRIHQSYIIRMSAVRKLMKLPEGDFVILENGEKIPVARRRRDAFVAAMKVL